MGTAFKDDDMLTRQMLLAAATAVLVGAGVAAGASAQPGPGGWHHGGGGGLLEGVTLTDEQKTTLHTLMQNNHAATRTLREQLHTLHDQVETTLLSSGTVTAATLAPMVQQQEALMQQLDAQRVTEEIAVRNLLTPAQLSQAAAAHAQLATLHQQERALRGGGDEQPPE